MGKEGEARDFDWRGKNTQGKEDAMNDSTTTNLQNTLKDEGSGVSSLDGVKHAASYVLETERSHVTETETGRELATC